MKNDIVSKHEYKKDPGSEKEIRIKREWIKFRLGLKGLHRAGLANLGKSEVDLK